jgi:cell division protein FtsL
MMVRKPHPPRQVAAWAAVALLTVAIFFFYLWPINEKHRLGLDSTAREAELKALRVDVERLETRKAALLSLERVERIARTALGLTDPRPDQIVGGER